MDTLARPLYLPQRTVVRIDRGSGIGVRAESGRVWLTENGRRDDVVLEPGQRAHISRWGRALISALRPSWIVLDLSFPGAALASIEVAAREGGCGRPVPTVWPHVDEMRRRLSTWLRSARFACPDPGPPPGRHDLLRRIRRRGRAAPMSHSPDAMRDRLFLQSGGLV